MSALPTSISAGGCATQITGARQTPVPGACDSDGQGESRSTPELGVRKILIAAASGWKSRSDSTTPPCDDYGRLSHLSGASHNVRERRTGWWP